MPSKADSPSRSCSRPGCGKPLRARGLCSTHYNQAHQPTRHAAKPVACAICGKQVMRPTSSDRRPACSVRCRRAIQYGQGGVEGSGYSWASDAARRARLAGAQVIELFDRLDVFERDRWTCYLCCLPTDPHASPFSPSSPTVDHVVPLSAGGHHTMANARTACLGCNSSKQDRPAEAIGHRG
jgi:hypothetical protein